MKIFQVGGAVRDRLLGRPVLERDWVVVGTTPEALIELGFQPVGKDFPVFLHPTTHEEYALARTERKTGRGYTQFVCYSNPDVTLEEDLLRRDLTINAIAMSEDGQLIDPYGGQADLKLRVLRHVSPAFAEDPVRILRIARFAARYAYLGFHIADETYALMQKMVRAGEVNALVPERVWQELQSALAETHPARFFEELRRCGALALLLPELDQLFGIPNPKTSHPEIDTGIHSLLCLQQAASLSNDCSVRFAALLHDVGKAATPPTQWPHHTGHEEAAAPFVQALCLRCRAPRDYQTLAALVARYHLYCHQAFALDAKAVLYLLTAVDGFRRPERFQQFLTACEADARGRIYFEETPYSQRTYLEQLFRAASAVSTQPLIAKGLQGKALGEALQQERLIAIQHELQL